jgi:hypothetical protein
MTKIVGRVIVKKIRAKNINEAFKLLVEKQRHFFYQNLSKMAKVGGFLAGTEFLLTDLL